MSRVPASRSVAASLALVVVALLVLTGCDELSARRLIQEANRDYADQEFEKAAAKFEAALRKAPDLQIAHHNLGITYSRLFKAGLETPANKALAEKATDHLQIWLAKHPKDDKVRKLMTNLWIDAGDYQRAIDFWKKVHDEDPKARDVIQRIGAIYLKSGDWRTSVEWYEKDVAAAVDGPGRLSGLTSITNIAFNKMLANRDKVLGPERLELSEIGLAAAADGIKIDDKSIAMWSISGGLWNQRALAQGPSWAVAVDRAEAQVYQQRTGVLKEEAKKAAPPTQAPASPGKGS